MTEQEIIDIVTHYKNGGEVEWRDFENRSSVWTETEKPVWNFGTYEYRKKPEPKTRLMTAEELKGKWIKRGNHSQMVIAIVFDEIETVTEGPKTVKKFHENGWTLEDNSPLEVEVEDE